MSGLWEDAVSLFKYGKLKEFCDKINFSDIQPEGTTTDIEKLLTHAQLFQHVIGDTEVDELINKLKKW